MPYTVDDLFSLGENHESVEHMIPEAVDLDLMEHHNFTVEDGMFHHDGGFWHLDQLTGKETALDPAASLQIEAIDERLMRIAKALQD